MITIFEALEKMKAIPEGIKKPKIVVVDDDLSFTSMLSDFLYEECKLRTDVYTNGEAFLEDFTAEDFRIIILDYYFDSKSNLNGIEILKAIMQKNKFAVVIMVSGQDDLEIAIETIRNGATDYFYKANQTVFANIVSSIIKLLELQKQQFN
jgi:FixJ family two-component response regulator